MTLQRPLPRSLVRVPRSQQNGFILVVTLICLVLMLVASIALTRSSANSLIQAGNFAFKRDLLNQAECGFSKGLALLKTGGSLASAATRQSNQLAYNYSALQLASNDQGVPKALLVARSSSSSSSSFTGTDINGASLAFTGADVACSSSNGVTVRYVIDRQCSAVGAFNSATCVSIPQTTTTGGTARLQHVNPGAIATYRISVRVDGPRNTQTFQQMIVSL